MNPFQAMSFVEDMSFKRQRIQDLKTSMQSQGIPIPTGSAKKSASADNLKTKGSSNTGAIKEKTMNL